MDIRLFLKETMKKVLILGSGALKIGEAGEFDYSGSQAIKALKEEGIKTVLVNPNIATIQTSKFLADTVYFLPVTDFFVEKVIAKEKPDGILLSFGGQTALNCGIELYKKGVLQKYQVKILGTPMSAILLTEDRHKFVKHLQKIGVPVPLSQTANNVNGAIKIAKRIGFPVMIRAGFALGGQGSGVAKNVTELTEIAAHALHFSHQILVEKYLHHFKEVEYEVVRDEADNCITVCNMENMDPLGIHTGDSIVVAPSQTLTNFEYHSLRSVAIRIVRSLKIIGECNVQFALNPKSSLDYYVIEVNARLSRSSALASKATGYPLAYVAAKLALGKNLTKIKNKVTDVTQSCFEPALDYIVVKIPRWDMEKFKGADERIGSGMKSVGEVMGIGRTFEEAYQKAIRMLDLNLPGAVSNYMANNGKTLIKQLSQPTPKRIFAIAKALEKNLPIEKIYWLTGIDPWFLYRIKNIVDEEKILSKSKINKQILQRLKELGFSDKRIGELINKTELEIRSLRKKWGITPSVFQIDTLAGEFPAQTNYLYLTYNGSHHDTSAENKKGVIVLGSGPYRIGSSVEFDWTSVNTVLSLKEHNKKSIIINCNPETVSTDYDISDKLYFEELTFERIADIYEFENPAGIIISVGGQTPNNQAYALNAYGCRILGTNPADIDKAEDRNKFSRLLDQLHVSQPAWNKFATIKDAQKFCQKVGFPVLIRPSYVLSGSAMNICHNQNELLRYLKKATLVSRDYPITVSKFIEEAKEVELDAVAQKGKVAAMVISEHIENAGVHSGDATIVLPAATIIKEAQTKMGHIAAKLAQALSISGPFNIQFLAKDGEVSVIEINLRSSRTLPFISKVTGIDFIKIAVNSFFGKQSNNQITASAGSRNGGIIKQSRFVAVKVPQFSFARLTGADPILHVEMASTGEVACFGEDVQEAFLKGELAVGGKIPQKGIFISLGGEENKQAFLKSTKNLDRLKVPIFATDKTSAFLQKQGIATKLLYKIYEKKSPNILEYFQNGRVDLAINLVDPKAAQDESDHYTIRRAAIDFNIPIYTNLKKAKLFVQAITSKTIKDLSIRAWHEYV
ncbi:carbamoyl-phosphate synthase (glutamine-hydrolyzing) large subunit [Candidatus Microgenomates bacterium]|nr:carbamoyl-phosphate synthase (glutamine-hydrolyzing) large subunit [Candidatus Microgenomates bacterium]